MIVLWYLVNIISLVPCSTQLPPEITISFELSNPTTHAILILIRFECFIGKPSKPSRGLIVDKSVSMTSTLSVDASYTNPPNM